MRDEIKKYYINNHNGLEDLELKLLLLLLLINTDKENQ